MSNKVETTIQEGENLCDLAAELIKKGDYQLALTHYNSAEEIFKSVHDTNWVVFAQHEKFICFQSLDLYDSAIKLSEEIITNYQQLEKYEALALFLVLSANVHTADGNTSKAIEQLRMAEHMIQLYNLEHLKAYIQSNLAASLINNEQYLEALDYINKAIDDYKKQGLENGLAWCYEYIARCQEELFLFSEAEKNYYKSQRRYLALNDGNGALNPLKSLKHLYNLSGKKEKELQMQEMILKIESNSGVQV